MSSEYPYPMEIGEQFHDQAGEIGIGMTVGSREQRLAARRFLGQVDTADLRRRLAAGYARIPALDVTEAERIHGKLAANGHRVDQDLAHLAGQDDGYVWHHHDRSLIGTVTRGPDPEVGSVHLLHQTIDDELTGGRSTSWAWYVVYSAVIDQMAQDVRTDDDADVEYTGLTTVTVHRVARLSFPVLAPLTTAQAAELAGMEPSSFRGLVTRASRRGTELRLPRGQWPDARTPLYDAVELRRYLAGRSS